MTLSAFEPSYAGGKPPVEEVLTAPGPDGPLAGTLTLPTGFDPLSDETPMVLIVPGSGPTDRDGNSPFGIAAATYRCLAHALAGRGYPSVRTDKRGLFGSADAVPDANDVTVAAYGDDVLSWARAIRARLPTEDGTRRVVPLGHSEGGLVALAAMARLPGPCGLILASTPGRPLGDVLRGQLHADPASAPILADAEAAITTLERGGRVDRHAIPPALRSLFAPQVQAFLIDLFSYDPVEAAAVVTAPTLVVQGTDDRQVGAGDARRLAGALADATLALLPRVNHVLKAVPSADPSANRAAYADPDLPIAPGVVEAVVRFLARIAAS